MLHKFLLVCFLFLFFWFFNARNDMSKHQGAKEQRKEMKEVGTSVVFVNE